MLLACALALLILGYLGWALAACVVVALAFVAPRALFLLLPPAVAFGSLFTLALGGLSAGSTDLLVAGLILAAGWRLTRHRWRRLREPSVHQPPGRALSTDASPVASLTRFATRWPVLAALLGTVALYLCVILLSGLVATSRVAVAKEALKWGEVWVVIAAAWLLLRRSPRWLALTLGSVVATGLAEALLGYAQWALGTGDLGPGGDSIRVFGTFGQPNPYAADLNLALLPALAVVLFGVDARVRWVFGAAAVLIFGAEALADSRGALLALVVAVVILLVLGFRRERQATLVALIGIPLLAIAWVAHVIPVHVQQRILAQVRLSDVSLSGQVNDANYSTIERLAHWVAGLRMFVAHPLLGVGAGNYDAAYARYALPDWPESLGHAHNYYINAAAETGTLGLLAFLALVAAALFSIWRATRAWASPSPHPPHADDGSQENALAPTVTERKRAGSSALSAESTPPASGIEGEVKEWWPTLGTRAIALGCSAVVVAVLVHSLVDDLFVHAMALQFALMLGILAVLASSALPALQRAAHERKRA